jgi:predicted O-methyltransferase YrrM
MTHEPIAQALFARIAARAWMIDDVRFPEAVRRVPTMLTLEEQRMLAWVAEHRPHPRAAVCDLGSFLGGSTVALAQGIRNSRQPTRLHAFDRFRMREQAKEKYLYAKGYPRFAGGSVLHIVRDHLAPFDDLVELHAGELGEQRWIGDPISILFIDISKSWETNDFILSQFFPCLLSGSIIVQQDFFFTRNPWLHSTMHKLAHKIAYAGATERNSAIFEVNETPSQAEIESCLRRNTPNADVVAAIDALLERFSGDRFHLPVLRRLKQVFESAPDTPISYQFSTRRWVLS